MNKKALRKVYEMLKRGPMTQAEIQEELARHRHFLTFFGVMQILIHLQHTKVVTHSFLTGDNSKDMAEALARSQRLRAYFRGGKSVPLSELAVYSLK